MDIDAKFDSTEDGIVRISKRVLQDVIYTCFSQEHTLHAHGYFLQQR